MNSLEEKWVTLERVMHFYEVEEKELGNKHGENRRGPDKTGLFWHNPGFFSGTKDVRRIPATPVAQGTSILYRFILS